jgi:hypothetical protein
VLKGADQEKTSRYSPPGLYLTRVNNMRKKIAFCLFCIGVSALVNAQLEPGLAVNLGYGVGFAVGSEGEDGAMERRSNVGLEYRLYQFPDVSLGFGAMLSRGDSEEASNGVVAMLGINGELAAKISRFAAADLSMYIRFGYFEVNADGASYDDVQAFSAGFGFRLIQCLPNLPAVKMFLDLGYTRNYDFRNYAYFASGFSVQVLKPRPIRLENLELAPVFPALGNYYSREPIGYITLINRDVIPIEDISVSIDIEGLVEAERIVAQIPLMEAGSELRVPLSLVPDAVSLARDEGSEVPVRIQVTYRVKDGERQVRLDDRILLYNRNAIAWVDDARIASFVSSQDDQLIRISRNAVAASSESGPAGIDINIQKLLAIHSLLSGQGVAYVTDPESPFSLAQSGTTVDYVQFPGQTLANRAGDCDDLSVLYAALLEAVGVPTAFITIPGHIFIAIALDDEPAPELQSMGLIERDGHWWLPFETTYISGHSAEALKSGYEQWTRHQAEARFFTLSEARGIYPSAHPDIPIDGEVGGFSDSDAARAEQEAQRLARELIADSVSRIENRMSAYRRGSALNLLGIVHAKYGLFEDAREYFNQAIREGAAPAAWENLGNLSYLQNDFSGAQFCYQQAIQLGNREPELLLQLARCAYELEQYSEAARLFDQAGSQRPDLIPGNAYLRTASQDAEDQGARGNESADLGIFWRESLD